MCRFESRGEVLRAAQRSAWSKLAHSAAASALLVIGSANCAEVGADVAAKLQAGVFQLAAQHANGQRETGSAVLIAADRLVTNCHVTRGAQDIELTGGGARWRAQLHSADSERDICVLQVRGIDAAPVGLATSHDLEVGQPVYAAGYRNGTQFSLSAGEIVALYPYAGAQVIRTSAAFDRGQSGGGLFDRDGRLVGILTFKSAEGGEFHFALPSDWAVAVDAVAAPRNAIGKAFWERPSKAQPAFLRAASLEIAGNWDGLLNLGRQWTDSEGGNPEAWLARGKAAHHDKRRLFEASAAYREAEKLKPRDARVRRQLENVNRDLACSRYGWCGTSIRHYQ